MESSQILKISQMMGHILQLFVTLKDLGPFHGGLRLDISTAPGIINQIRLFFLSNSRFHFYTLLPYPSKDNSTNNPNFTQQDYT